MLLIVVVRVAYGFVANFLLMFLHFLCFCFFAFSFTVLTADCDGVNEWTTFLLRLFLTACMKSFARSVDAVDVIAHVNNFGLKNSRISV